MAYKICKCPICKPGKPMVRISLTLEQYTIDYIQSKADEDGISFSAAFRHLLKDAMDLFEKRGIEEGT